MSDNLTIQQQNIVPGFSSRDSFNLLWSMSAMFAQTTLVPKHFRGNQGNCAIAINMANRMGADPLMVMQNMYIVYGNPAWSSKFLIATFNQCGRYSSIKYKMVGTKGSDDYGCFAYATELSTGEVIEGPTITIGIAKAEGWYQKDGSKWVTMPEQMLRTITIGIAKAEGWYQKDGSKWVTMPEQMLRYRAASWFIRTTAPELSMGLQTVEEAQDINERDITPVEKPTAEIAQNMATKVLDVPKPEPKTKIEQEISKPPTQKKEPVKKEKSTQENIQDNLQEELSETPAF